MPRPAITDYSGFNAHYVDLTTLEDVKIELQESLTPMLGFLTSIPESKADHAYATGKWTLKELLQHCTDTERIMAYRALCVARGEQQNLPGFEENDYAAASNANLRDWQGLIEEAILVRQSSILLFNYFTEEQLQKVGTSNNRAVTANALGFIIVGHFLHHQHIVNERYLVQYEHVEHQSNPLS